MENEILFTIGVKIVFGFMLGGVAVLIYNYGFALIETIVAFCILLIPFLIGISRHGFKDTLIQYILMFCL